MKILRALFLGRNLREKLYLLVFVLLLFGIWFSSFNRRAWAFRRSEHATTVDLSDQKMWLSNRDAIEESARRSAARLDPARTLDEIRLLGAVSKLAAECNLPNFTSAEARHEGNANFIVHTLQVNVTKAEWTNLTSFYKGLLKRAPYIAIAQFSLSPDRANPSLANMSLRISSVEVVR